MDKEKELDDLFTDRWERVQDRRFLLADEDPEDEEGDNRGFFSDELRYSYRRIDDL